MSSDSCLVWVCGLDIVVLCWSPMGDGRPFPAMLTGVGISVLEALECERSCLRWICGSCIVDPEFTGGKLCPMLLDK